MIINEVTLRNFGIYQGEHSYNFRTEPSKQNVILINAKNGSGKTTLLTGIKIGLYGPLLMGYRHINQKYSEFIKDKINSSFWMEVEPKASILLNFSMGGYGTAEDILLERSWIFHNNQMTEKVKINKDGKELSPKEVIEFENFTRKYLPPSLFDFFLFDGEEIHHQLEEGVLLKSIKDAFYSLFNLDLTASLQQDLRSYLKQDSIFKKLDKEQQEYNLLLEKYTLLQTQSIEELDKIKAMEEQIEELGGQTKKLELEFKLNDGLAAEERDQARLDFLKYEHKKHEEADSLKTFVAEILPFYISKDLLISAKEHVALESRQRAIDILRDTMLEELKEHYVQLINNENINITKDGQPNYSSALWDSLTSSLSEMTKPLAFYHDLNNSEKEHLFSLTDRLERLNPQFIAHTQINVAKYNNKIYKLKKKIEVNENNEELNCLLQQINQNNQIVMEITRLKDQLIVQQNNTSEFIIKVYADLINTEKILQQSHKNDNIYSIVIRIDKVLSQFQNEVVRQKTETINSHFLECFVSLNHKDNYIKSADFRFEDNNFKIQLFGKDHSVISYNQLSAGEKQIFLLSFTWALLKTSQREVPLFFDTLLGRLDNDHRENIIKIFLPHISKQVVVLSTDTEINDYYYKLLKPHISLEYDIRTNNENGRVVVIKKSQGGQMSHAI